MSKKEKAKKDIEVAFEFARHLIDHPEDIAKIPDGSEIVFYEKSDLPQTKKAANGKKLRVDIKRGFEIKRKVA
jgi:hypothetical protein